MSQTIVLITATKKESTVLAASTTLGLPYHRITDIRRLTTANDTPIKITVDDGSRWGKVYTVTETLAAIEAAVAAYTDPVARFTVFDVTKKVGSSFIGDASIGEHLILEVLDRGANGMTLTVDNGTVYADIYEVSDLIADLTTAVTPA